jgi:hypothetical protein
MRTRPMKVVLSILLLGILVLPGLAQGKNSAYTMQGGGNLTLTSGPGLAFTGPSTTSTYTFATLPIQGDGLLLDMRVVGLYNCPSSVTITGVGLNFSINWNFSCSRTSGIGPNPIVGNFHGKYPLFNGTFTPYKNGNPKGTVKSKCTGAAIPTSVANGHVKKMTFIGECNVP